MTTHVTLAGEQGPIPPAGVAFQFTGEVGRVLNRMCGQPSAVHFSAQRAAVDKLRNRMRCRDDPAQCFSTSLGPDCSARVLNPEFFAQSYPSGESAERIREMVFSRDFSTFAMRATPRPRSADAGFTRSVAVQAYRRKAIQKLERDEGLRAQIDVP